jgi:hypothetical protein
MYVDITYLASSIYFYKIGHFIRYLEEILKIIFGIFKVNHDAG